MYPAMTYTFHYENCRFFTNWLQVSNWGGRIYLNLLGFLVNLIAIFQFLFWKFSLFDEILWTGHLLILEVCIVVLCFFHHLSFQLLYLKCDHYLKNKSETACLDKLERSICAMCRCLLFFRPILVPRTMCGLAFYVSLLKFCFQHRSVFRFSCHDVLQSTSQLHSYFVHLIKNPFQFYFQTEKFQLI